MTNQTSTHARTWLFTPVSRSGRFASASVASAGAAILDLQDAAPSGDRASARITVLDQLADNRGPIALRPRHVNEIETRGRALERGASLGSVPAPDSPELAWAEAADHLQGRGRLRLAAAEDAEHADLIESARGGMSFGPFRLFPSERLLERDRVPVAIGGRALDILICLAERAGEVVSKKELVARVWADVHVDEGSLRFHVAALRKALGEGGPDARYVSNVPGRGYCLVAPVCRSSESGDARPNAVAPPRPKSIPARMERMVGREETVQRVKEQLLARRFLTIVGPGGIGKTTVAVAAGHALLDAFEGAVCFLDLSSFSDARQAFGALASTFGLSVHSDDPVQSMLTSLRDKRTLLVMDNCEHLVEALAELAEGIFESAPRVHILATSRESLRAEGEHVLRLFPLACPPKNVGREVAEVLAYPAAQLFVERVGASVTDYEPCNSDAAAIAEICAKLDGIPLAIELVASRVAAYGMQGTAKLLDNRFGLSWHGRRTAAPRHQTLSAALDWSYDLLPQSERVILRRLAVFVGCFTLEAALAIAASDGSDEGQVVEGIADLISKSLVSPVADTAPMRYRLLDMTRTYAIGKLIDSGEANAIARRHALHFRRCLERAIPSDISPAGRDARSGQCLGDLRAALEWCFSPEGDHALGVDLDVASTHFVSQTSLTERHRWSERATSAVDGRMSLFARGNTEEDRGPFTRGLGIEGRSPQAPPNQSRN